MKRERAGKATGDVLGPPNVRVANLARVSGASSAALRIVSAAFVLTSCRTPSLEQLISRPEPLAKVWTPKWKDHIWVILNDEKVPLSRTCLIKYFKHGSNEVSTSCRGKRNFHRDEFVTCSSCEKERCFHLQTKEDCMIYHAAAADKKWKCSDRPYDKITCVDDEERDSFTGDVLKVSRNARVALLVCVCWVPQVPFKGVRLQPLC
ncbi:hypothetical protein LWI29_024759 [Acer saccharum]|uniref:Uncharacterized protein n=1 Tax=Acer saccharum TaxID=4024 RepID=A0AA39T4T9_ACESA|nr:hypothetical protein LWI29_024759 [Acer saccharum]